MRNPIFLQILNMSFTSCFVIVLICIARLFLKKVPTVFSYTLWSAALFRLLCPFSIQSFFSLLPVTSVPFPVKTANAGAVQSLPVLSASGFGAQETSALETLTGFGALIWLAGMAGLVLYSGLSMLRLRRKLVGAVRLRGNIYLADHIATPFVLGVFRPNIYLPSALSGPEQRYVILHERTHIRRLDHIVKLAAFAALCIHWFNPFVWLAFRLAVRDMEMSCDESVMKQLDPEIRKEYAASLLRFATGRNLFAGLPPAFGEGDTKSRIKNVIRYRKPSFWVFAVSLAIVAVIVTGLISNPGRMQQQSYVQELWGARTQYIGNNSAVGRLLTLLPPSEDLQYDHFALQTKERPYTIEIVYSVTPEVLAQYNSQPSSTVPLQKNALILLALVDNADCVTAVLTDGKNKLRLRSTREWADKASGGDTRAYAATAEKLQELIDLPLSSAVYE